MNSPLRPWPGLAGKLDRVPELAGTPRTVTELPGGLTNHNYKVSTPDGAFVARVWSGGGELLAIDRDYEYHNSVAAAQAGVGAPVIDYRPEDNMLVLGYIDGRTLRQRRRRGAGQPAPDRRACRQLHAGPRFADDFDMFEIQARYAAVTAELGIRIPAGYDGLMPQLEAARRALAVRDEGTVPCNNDLLAANFIDDGSRIWLIDYEYAGNNDACFELGNIGGECRLPADGLAELVTAYYGRPLRNKIARAAARAWRACTAGRCGARSSTRPARSTSTSGRGRWSAARAPSPASPARLPPAARRRAAHDD